VVIPGNDDAIRAIRIYTEMAADAVLAGRGSKGEFSGGQEFVEIQEQGAAHEPCKPATAQAASAATQNSVLQESLGETEPAATASLGDVASVPAEEPGQADPRKADR
jgi:small subunit ribosomal protein S2